MKLGTAFATMVALAIVLLALAGLALAWAIGASQAVAQSRAHGLLAGINARLADAYISQVHAPQEELAAPLDTPALGAWTRGITSAVLAPYAGVEGGFYVRRRDALVGYAFPTHGGPRPKEDVPPVERPAIVALVERVTHNAAAAATVLREGHGDVVVLDARPIILRGRALGAAWTMERIAGARAAGDVRQRLVAATVVFVALVLVALAVYVMAVIRRDVSRLTTGLQRLHTDPAVRITPLGGELGIVSRAVNEMADVRFRAEAQARRSERLAALGRVVTNVAHEIRNPLNALRLQAALLERRSAGASAATRNFTAEIERLDAIVARMLAVGRGDDEMAKRPVDLYAVAEHGVARFADEARARGITLRLRDERARRSHPGGTVTGGDGDNGERENADEARTKDDERKSERTPDNDARESVDGNRADVRGDSAALERLVINLLANALQASAAGADVEVVLADGPVLTVVDRGSGISAADAAHLFEPFFTTKSDGTGLGLAISREIAAAHGADLNFESVAGRTAFRLSFDGAPRA